MTLEFRSAHHGKLVVVQVVVQVVVRVVVHKEPPQEFRVASEGLRALGFEFRFVPCDVHAKDRPSDPLDLDCRRCVTRLFHVDEAGTWAPITPQNRPLYAADGPMYELVASWAQRAAQDRMREAFRLEWVTLCDEKGPVRALVDHRLAFQEEEKKEDVSSEPRSTLLVATGRGKVRAGIFSRHHLLTGGIELGTAWHSVREARRRDMGVAIIDPNARGEQEAMDTFDRSVRRLFLDAPRFDAMPSFRSQESFLSESNRTPSRSHSIYVLAHSASGGQLVRHLRQDATLLSRIRAIAFTDSTHSVQWCKHDPALMRFLQKDRCVYFRSNDVRSTTTDKLAGTKADADRFWEHRFGKIKTLWAGTQDHALSNWAGHDHIWDHFDDHAAESAGRRE